MSGLIRRTVEVPCTVDIEHTIDHLHAHVELQGYDPQPGDRVIVHGAPTDVPFGERIVVSRRATVTTGNWLDFLTAKVGGFFEITELFEVGFSEGRAS